MKKKIIVIVRYSLLLEKGNTAWKIGRDVTFEQYRENLFAADRLAQHQRLFNDVTLRSILDQEAISDDVEIELLIATSSELPAINMAYLDELSAAHSFIHILKVDTDGSLGGALKPYLSFCDDTLCLTMRLDDDDALAKDFFKRCEQYLDPAFTGYVVTFASGYQGWLNEDTQTYANVEKLYYPKIALGLGFINRYSVAKGGLVHPVQNIYAAGNHTKLDEKYPMIVDARKPAFFRSLHKLSDTQGKVSKRKVIADAGGAVIFNECFPHLTIEK